MNEFVADTAWNHFTLISPEDREFECKRLVSTVDFRLARYPGVSANPFTQADFTILMSSSPFQANVRIADNSRVTADP